MRNLMTSLLAAFALSALGPVAFAAAPKADADVTADPLARKITGSRNYVSMFGMRASVVSGFTVSGFISVDAGLDVPNSRMRKQIQATRPRLMDAMRQSLMSYANGPYKAGTAPNLDMLSARMQRAIDRQIGAGNATVVLASVIVFEQE